MNTDKEITVIHESKMPVTKSNVAKTSYLSSYAKCRSSHIAYWKDRGLVRGTMTRTEALFEDKYLEYFASDEVAQLLSPDEDLRQPVNAIDKINPLIFPMFSVRHCFFNQQLELFLKELDHIPSQVIILGAGFDTRSVNYKKDSVKFFEIDQPATLEIKQKIYNTNKTQINAVYIGIDYVNQNLIESLKNYGIDFDKPTLVIWEGNIVYLPIEMAKRVITSLNDNFKRLLITFDYYNTAIYQKKTAHKDWSMLAEALESMRAPFKSGIDDMQAFAKEMQMNIKTDQSGADLLMNYGIDTDPDDKLTHYRVCTLTRGQQ